MFLNDSARVKILLLVLMSEIKNNLTRGKNHFFLLFNLFTGYNISRCRLSPPGVGCIGYVTLAL